MKADSDAMFLTTLQKIFSVLNHKTRLEKIHGEMSNLAVYTQMFQITLNAVLHKKSNKGLISIGSRQC